MSKLHIYFKEGRKMNRKAVSGITIMLLFVSILNVAFQIKPAIAESGGSYISVPYHSQSKYYYCGPASLGMVFDFYGPYISQVEIADVARTSSVYGGTFTDDMTRAVHFSNLSTSVGDEWIGSITGYSARKLGYASFEHWGLTLEELKSLIDAGYPIIVLTWFTEAKAYGHFRVVVGYNETHVTFHDPWFGPMLSMTNSKFLDFWEYSYYWGLFVSPWNVTISAPQNVLEGHNFTITATVTYPCPIPFPIFDYPASSTNATIILPEGIGLVPGETAKKLVDAGSMVAGDMATVDWIVKPDNPGAYTFGVEIEGKITGSVSEHGPYPGYSYKDRIGGFADSSVTVISATIPPGMSADLVRRGAWPEHHHYDISQDEDGYQTLYAKVKNLGNQSAWAKAVFNVTSDDGSSITVETEPLLIAQEEIVELSSDFGPLTDKDVGKYYVSVKCWYGHKKIVWAQGEKEKTVKFNIVP